MNSDSYISTEIMNFAYRLIINVCSMRSWVSIRGYVGILVLVGPLVGPSVTHCVEIAK